MRNFLFSAVGSLALLSAMTFTSCKEDRCKSVVCANSGACNDDGSCSCQVGYEGERCETISRDKFKGVWGVAEAGSSTGPISYTCAVEDGASIDQVEIRNFYNLFDATVKANVKGDTLYIPLQDLADGEDIKKIEGKGHIDIEGYYGLQGRLILRYRVQSSDGSINNFGMSGADNPSIWTK